MRTFTIRAISGIVYALLMIVGIFYAEPIYFLGLLCFLIFIGTKELFRLSAKVFPKQNYLFIYPLLTLLSIISLVLFVVVNDSLLLLPLIVMPVILMFSIILSKNQFVVPSITVIFGILYIGLPMMALAQLKFIDPIIPLAVLIMVWVNDTMAYISGSMIGKIPLSPISPKKTIEGTIGGVLFTVIFAGVFGYYYDHEFPIWVWMVMAAIVGVFGNVGDLFESYLKRTAGVKDSGNIMPGHGGVLDRIDSLLFVFPVVYVFLISCKLI